MNFRALVSAVFAVASLVHPARAEDVAAYPSRPITMIVTSAAGSGTDATSRIIARVLSEKLGQTVVVENVPGAGTSAGTARAARSAADGYTILVASISSIGLAPMLRTDLTYDTEDLAPIGQINSSSGALLVNPQKITVKALPEFLTLLKENPGKYNFGTPGIGVILHMMTELFMQETGTVMTHVPFKSGGEVNAALLGGHIDLSINNLTSSLSHVKDGSLTALAVFAPEREPDLPDVPTIKETYPDFPAIQPWSGLFAPVGTPKVIIDKISTMMADYLKSPEGIAEMRTVGGARAVGSSPAEFAKAISDESAIWAEIIKSNGIKVE